MENQKAIEVLRRKTSIPEEGESFDDISSAFDMAIAALEKQIPEKPQYTEDKIFAICKCNGKGLVNGWKFCPECGQAIDWSE